MQMTNMTNLLQNQWNGLNETLQTGQVTLATPHDLNNLLNKINIPLLEEKELNAFDRKLDIRLDENQGRFMNWQFPAPYQFNNINVQNIIQQKQDTSNLESPFLIQPSKQDHMWMHSLSHTSPLTPDLSYHPSPMDMNHLIHFEPKPRLESKPTNKPIQTQTNSLKPRKRYECSYEGCGRVFPRLYNLKSHQLCHTGEKPHQCQFCDTSFGRKHDLQRHVRTLHSSSRPYICPNCQQGFNRLDGLKKHMVNEEKGIETGSKLFQDVSNNHFTNPVDISNATNYVSNDYFPKDVSFIKNEMQGLKWNALKYPSGLHFTYEE